MRRKGPFLKLGDNIRKDVHWFPLIEKESGIPVLGNKFGKKYFKKRRKYN